MEEITSLPSTSKWEHDQGAPLTSPIGTWLLYKQKMMEFWEFPLIEKKDLCPVITAMEGGGKGCSLTSGFAYILDCIYSVIKNNVNSVAA